MLIAVATWLTDGPPIFLGHSRLELDGSRFRSLNFRSLRQDAEQLFVHLLAKDPVARPEWQLAQKLTNGACCRTGDACGSRLFAN